MALLWKEVAIGDVCRQPNDFKRGPKRTRNATERDGVGLLFSQRASREQKSQKRQSSDPPLERRLSQTLGDSVEEW